MSPEEIDKLYPLFFNGDPKMKTICGLPGNANVKSVNDLVVIDTIHGFRYPQVDEGVDDILLLPRWAVLEKQPNQASVQAALDELQQVTKRSLSRGKKRIVSFQSSGSMYLTPGAYPRRNGHGLQV